LSSQLDRHGWNSVLGFLESPPDSVAQVLHLPNVTLTKFERAAQPSWRAANDLAALVRQFRPRIVHLHFTGFLTPYPWVARMCGVDKVFFTDQTSRPEGYRPRRAALWKRALTRMINHPIERVISVSGYGYNCMMALDVLPADRFRMIYNSIELARLRANDGLGAQFRRKHGIPADRPLVVQVSWIIPEKGILDLLAALKILRSRRQSVHCAFVGEGAYRQQYTQVAADWGLSELVTWTGVAEDPFAEGVYAAADVVCQVSRWEEVFGWTIAEGMAHQKPLIGTRVGGIPELVRDGISGFLVERGDAAAIADRIALLVTSPDLRATMGRAGRSDVETKFNLAPNVTRLLEIYGIVRSSEAASAVE